MKIEIFFCDICEKEICKNILPGKNRISIKNWETQKEGENLFGSREFHLCNNHIKELLKFFKITK